MQCTIVNDKIQYKTFEMSKLKTLPNMGYTMAKNSHVLRFAVLQYKKLAETCRNETEKETFSETKRKKNKLL